MCVIIACEDEFPTLETLESCEQMNSDGGGIGWITSSKEVQFVKGIDAKGIHDLIVSGIVKLPCIIHFRIASVGEVTKQLTHPFIMSKDSRLDLSGKLEKNETGLLFHNGTISEYEEILKRIIYKSKIKMPKGDFSDSRVMALASGLYGHTCLNLVTGWNKFAVLDKSGITKYGNWHDLEKGIQSSNDFFKQISYGNPYGYGYLYEDDMFIDEYEYPAYKLSVENGKYVTTSYNPKVIDYEFEKARKDASKYYEDKTQLDKENDKALSLMFDKEALNKISKSHNEKIQKRRISIKQQVEAYGKSKRSKKRIDGINFLKSVGWGYPEGLSNKQVRKHVKREQTMLERTVKNQVVKNELALSDWLENKQGESRKQARELENKLDSMSADDYESLHLAQQNDFWANRSNEIQDDIEQQNEIESMLEN